MSATHRLFAALVKEPFSLTPEQIAKLTPYQVRHLYCRHDDEADAEEGAFGVFKGDDKKPVVRVSAEEPQQAQTYEETFRGMLRAMGKDEMEVSDLWNRHLRGEYDGP